MMKRKKMLAISLIVLISLCFIACSKSTKNYINYKTSDKYEDFASITYEDKVYLPYCVIDNEECKNQIGIVDNDEKNCIYSYKDYSTNEWIIELYKSGEMDAPMLYKEVHVTNLLDGLTSEYEWE
ncbi:hypothetical protein P261_02552 [Lachnospiraceae bacterium TWA4]|nr:hypothetical protein P261_02552 [Lachnospiraceae bacterium TWA4]